MSLEEAELDSLLHIFGNPIRRRIIGRLSREPSHALQLSKELGLGQSLVAKHLVVLEKAGLVESTVKESERGPRRREYFLTRSVTLSMDSAPCFFSVRGHAFDSISKDSRESREGSQLLKKAGEILGYQVNEDKIGSYSKLIAQIDGRLASLGDRRTVLLYLRNQVMRDAVAAVRKSNRNADERGVLYHVLDAHNRSVSEISESLHIKASTVERILADLKDGI